MSTLPETKDRARELFLHGHFSDMIIKCRGVEFKAHRSIESTEQPVINVQGDTPETLARVLVLAYLYLGDYDDVGQDLHFRSTTAPSDDSNAAKQETKFKHTDPAR
ncbi:hypothetical protein PoHVEF18_002623 [Penicillium ochrochloron]